MEAISKEKEQINYLFLSEDGKQFSVRHLVEFMGQMSHGGYSGFNEELFDTIKYVAMHRYPREDEGSHENYAAALYFLFGLLEALNVDSKEFNVLGLPKPF